jgi:hypothetical protein
MRLGGAYVGQSRRHTTGTPFGVGQRFQQGMVKIHRRTGGEKDHDAAPIAHPTRGRGLRADCGRRKKSEQMNETSE